MICEKWSLWRWSFIAALFLTTTLGYSQRRLETLEDARSELQVPNYTSADQRRLAVQSHFAIENLFVHRELKIQDFGQDHDPVPALASLAASATAYSPEEFHDEISAIFQNLHDLHTNYVAPAPRRCGLPFIPLGFIGVVDEGMHKVLVSGKLGLGTEYVEDVERGMRLISYDGQPIEHVLGQLGHVSGGANPPAMRFRAIEMLSFRGATTFPLPDSDEMTLEFLDAEGEQLTLTIPWLALLDDGCLSRSPEDIPDPIALDVAMNMSVDTFQQEYNELFRETRNKSLPSPVGDTSGLPWEEVFDYALIETPAGRLGYLELKSFYWSNPQLDADTVTEAIRTTLETDLADADSLVVDVRGNPGGLIVFSEKIIQLFAPRGVEPTTVRMLANQLNEDIFIEANGGENRWSDAIAQARFLGEPYMAPLAITPMREANMLGQVWFKPVVVLTDSGCYSACDLFSAGMQDNDAGSIIGLHSTTGAGGANVMEYKVFRQIMANADENPFLALPFGQNFRLSWRQTIRAGANEGDLIEDLGILSDHVVPLTTQDVLIGESGQLMRAIHENIDSQSSQPSAGLAIKKNGFVNLNNSQNAAWTERVYGADRIDIHWRGDVVESVRMPATESPAEVELAVADLRRSWDDERVILKGYRRGNQVFQVVREIRWRGTYQSLPSRGLSYDFDSGLEDLYTVNVVGEVGTGWQVVDGKLRVGEGPKYDPQIMTRVFLPVNLESEGGEVTLDLSVDAESLSDSLRIYLINPNTAERQHIWAGSSLPLQLGTGFRLPNDWDEMEIVFEFSSDENWNFEGPIIDNLTVTQ